MHEWTEHNERITEILTQDTESENIEIIITDNVLLYCWFWPKKKTCREHCYEDLLTAILKKKITWFVGICSVPLSP